MMFTVGNVFSQGFTVEPYMGINQAPMPSTYLGTNYKMTFQGGVLGKYRIMDDLTVNLGLGVSDRRKQYMYSDTTWALEQYRSFMTLAGIDPEQIDSTMSSFGFNFDQITNTNGMAKILQLEIPISVRYDLKKLNFEVGGYIGFNLKVSKYEEITSDVPLLQSVDINKIDSSGTISLFFPPPHSESTTLSSSKENITSFNYGLKAAIGYSPDSFIRFYGAFCYDLNNYAIQTSNNLLNNNKYFFRLGISYDIRSLWINETMDRPKF